MHALRLPHRARIGQSEILIVEKKCVVHARQGLRDVRLPPAAVAFLERMLRARHFDTDFAGAGRPHAKAMHSDEIPFEVSLTAGLDSGPLRLR